MYSLAIFFLVSFCLSAQAQDAKRCPGGHTEGTQVNMGRYWYECRASQLIPKGCINDDGRRIEIGEAYETGNRNYKLQCVVDASGFLAFTYKSCVYNGVEHQPGDTWEDGKYYYSCDREGDYLRINAAGCIDQGRRVALNERVTKGDFVYQCRKLSSNGTCSMCPVACTKNGREYNIGESFELDNLVYICTNSDGNKGPIAIKWIGCLDEQRQHLKDGDRFFKNDVVYECAVRDQEAGVRPVGCVQRNEQGVSIERRLGCYWLEGDAPFQYEMTCLYSKERDTATKVKHRCSYKLTQGTYTMEPGCYQIVDKTAVACKKEGDDMNIRVFQVDQIGDLTSQGLRFC